MDIPGTNILITGGASGLGLAIATRLSAAGALVWVIDRDGEALERAAGQNNAQRHLQFHQADVSQWEEVSRFVNSIDESSGGLNVLINNAAILRDQALVSRLGRRIKKHSVDDWNSTIASNLTGTFLTAREVAAAMVRRRRGGLIVNISSVSRRGNAGQTAYAATKAAIDALTVTWSQELAVYGIRVAAIAPGFIETPMTSRISPVHVERLREKTPLKRFGTPEELAHSVVFVIENDYVNGKTIEVDGGIHL